MTKEKEQIQFLREQYKRKLTQGKLANEERKRYLENKVIVEDEYEYEETEGGESEGSIGGQLSFTGNLCIPAEGGTYVVTSRYGSRWGSQHYGIDLAPKVKGQRTKILSCGDGVVLDSRSGVGGFGCWIVIKHAEDLYSVYGHMKKEDLLVENGQSVVAGQHISYMGNEGQSTGTHLHFELNRNHSNRHGKGADGKPNTFNPEEMINFSGGSATREASTFEQAYCQHCVSHYSVTKFEEEDLPPMHKEISVGTEADLSNEAKELDEFLRETYTYNPLSILNERFEQSPMNRKKFLNTRYLALNSTKFENLKPINKRKFIHDNINFENHNQYCPDAIKIFEMLLKETGFPYFYILSGFEKRNLKERISAHTIGCAMDIKVESKEEARYIADKAWLIGFRSIAIGGDFKNKSAFIHLDIGPRGNEYQLGEVPVYKGPMKWSF